jgi:para-nitrobenzyl esterase
MMRRSWRLVFFLVALFGWSVAAAVTIHLSDGDVDGEATPDFQAYRGIPFAEPPLGKLRFSPPIPAKPWKPKVLDAKKYRHNCMQGSKFTPGQPRDTVDEDCLYLNVFVPTKKVESPMALPVFVWIHGGGYQGGGANESRLNGTFDVALDSSAIIVVPNYRLNIFGFLAGKMLRSKDPAGGTGNMGILDQRLALKWVQSNIKVGSVDTCYSESCSYCSKCSESIQSLISVFRLLRLEPSIRPLVVTRAASS